MTNPLEQISAVLESFATSQEKLFHIVDIVRASQGYVCVPVEPTEAMINAGSQAGEWGSDRDVWSAMLAASKETNRE